MNRREFLKTSVGSMAGATIMGSGLTGCAGQQIVRENVTPIDRLLESGSKVMWVAAHPDDESLAGPILAKAGPKLKNPIHLIVLTHGDGGECNLPEGCEPNLATIRGEEIKIVAALYGATLENYYYWNAPLPVETFPKRHEIAKKWVAEGGDPSIKIAKSIREFKPTILLTFCPLHGFTGHPEHQITSRFATAAIRMAADANADLTGEPFRVENTYYCLNHYWITRMLGVGDPMPYTEIFDARQQCIGEKFCCDVAADYTRPHRTQDSDMNTVRMVYTFIENMYLYRTDPFTEIFDPFEPVE